jgi:UDP:flavonoid glycosyltransferase YjiC (YdhE family)
MQITYAWELGGNLGHFAAAESLLAHLHHLGHHISICSPEGSEATFRRATFPYRWAPAPKRFAPPQAGALLGHASILRYAAGFHDESNLAVLLENWRSLLGALQTDIVIGDFAPAAMLSAYTLGIPRIAYDTGFFYPPEQGPLPILDPARMADTDSLRFEERAVLAIANACLERLGSPSLTSFDSLLRADDALLVNHASLDCFARSDSTRFIGPVLRFRQRLPDGQAGNAQSLTANDGAIRIFAYLNRHFEALDSVLDILADQVECVSTVYLGELGGNVDLTRWQRQNLRITRDFNEFERCIAETDVVICHGGNGTINHALAHGIPLVLLPMFREQELNSQRVRELGLGELADTALPAALPRLISRVARDLRVRTQAAAHAACVQHAKADVLASRVVDCARKHGATANSRRETEMMPGSGNPVSLDASTLDVVFLSYDEANADDHFARLCECVPHAQRVHGVKGFAQAHLEAARRARTERFIAVDADTVAEASFFKLHMMLPPSIAHSSLSWSSVNAVNGLSYGNGGIKIWRRAHLRQILSHEDEGAVGAMRYDFCFHAGYTQLSRCVGTTYPNGSPYQAFRAGFREAVKLGRDGHGRVVPVDVLLRRMDHVNFRRLIVWLSVGADARHGLWSILGARMGFVANHAVGFDPRTISDFEWLHGKWLSASVDDSSRDDDALAAKVRALGDEIRSAFSLTVLQEWGAERSKAFKASLAARRKPREIFDTVEVEL